MADDTQDAVSELLRELRPAELPPEDAAAMRAAAVQAAAQAVGRCRFTPATPWLTAVESTLAFKDFRLLKHEYDKLLSNFAFHWSLRHYKAASLTAPGRVRGEAAGMALL